MKPARALTGYEWRRMMLRSRVRGGMRIGNLDPVVLRPSQQGLALRLGLERIPPIQQKVAS